jgi:hypothetical protein
VAASQAVAQQTTVSLGAGSSAPGGSVSLGIFLTTSGAARPTIAKWTMTYSVVAFASTLAYTTSPSLRFK